MSRRLVLTTIGFLMTGLVVARDAKVGTQPGDTLPGPFRVFVVTGAKAPTPSDVVLSEERQNLGDSVRARKFHDFVTDFGLDPVVAVFSREAPPSADQPLGKLLKALDQAVERHKASRLRAFGVFLTLKGEFLKDETQSAKVKQIEAFAEQSEIKGLPLALDQLDSERTKAYQIAPDQIVTVLVYSNLTVKARFSFTADKPLDDAGIQTIMAEVGKLVGARK